MKCRHCLSELTHTFLDLGYAPPSNAYLTEKDLKLSEKNYPLRVAVCKNCWLVQTEDYAKASELFNSEYAYFSSTSKLWLQHAKTYFKKIVNLLKIDEKSMVIEVASNDGYLLKNFVEKKIPCLGIEPTNSTAQLAKSLGIPVIQEFFGEDLGRKLVKEGYQADLIIGNNVYAHVPDINDFTLGLKVALKDGGTINLEFPHLMRLMEFNQFDTIYHEHFSYLSLHSIVKIFASTGLRIYDVEELETHGGSLRIYGCHETDARETLPSISSLLLREEEYGLKDIKIYKEFQEKVNQIKNNFLEYLISQKKLGKRVVAYGAAAKGNTLLNYAGVKSDLLSCIYDAAPAKQGKYMPGSHIPIRSHEHIREFNPDCVVVLPWNIASEVKKQNEFLVASGVDFIIAIPELKIL